MSDRILIRYCVIARRVQALLDAPPGAAPQAPEPVRALLADGVERLGHALASMPGARGAPSPERIERLARAADARLGLCALRPPPPPSRR